MAVVKAVSRYAGSYDPAKGHRRAIPRSFPYPGRRKYRPPALAAAVTVTLRPLSIEEVRRPPRRRICPPRNAISPPPNIHVAGALRITLRTFGELTFQRAGLPSGTAALTLRRRTHCVTPV